jgi:hypothetical protein
MVKRLLDHELVDTEVYYAPVKVNIRRDYEQEEFARDMQYTPRTAEPYFPDQVFLK